jgi:dTMP kinase
MTIPRRGLFITFEGIDGSGKTTQLGLLDAWLQGQGIVTCRTREPGGSALGEQIREIVLHHRGTISTRAEALLYAADRAQHVATVVRPALERGEVVIQDRYLDSSIAYQGSGRGLGDTRIRELSLWAAESLLPDLTVLLDLGDGEATGRLTDRIRFDRIEAEDAAFRHRVRDAYRRLAAEEPERFLSLDGTAPRAVIAQAVQTRVAALLREPASPGRALGTDG